MSPALPRRRRKILDDMHPLVRRRVSGWVEDRNDDGEWIVTAEWIADALRSAGHNISASSIRTYRRAIKRYESFEND